MYDPEYKGMLGNVKNDSVLWLWNSALRQDWLEKHKIGQRYKIPLCLPCEFWGIPTNG